MLFNAVIQGNHMTKVNRISLSEMPLAFMKMAPSTIMIVTRVKLRASASKRVRLIHILPSRLSNHSSRWPGSIELQDFTPTRALVQVWP